MRLCNDIYYYLIKYLDLNTFKEYSLLNKEICYICKEKSKYIAKYFLNKYKVEFSDSGNFIYRYNNKSINDFINEKCEWMYEDILKLYKRTFNTSIIICVILQITSIPILPNMIKFYGSFNNLKVFPSQPSMTHFYGVNNNLVSFDVQPIMTHFYGSFNKLKSFPSQPEMTHFYGIQNELSNFMPQPKMIVFNDNTISSVSDVIDYLNLNF